MRPPGQQLLHVYLCRKLWRHPLAPFCEVVGFASHLPPFDCDKFLVARTFVFDSVRKFLVSGFFCTWAAPQESRGTSRHVAAHSTGAPKFMCLYILSSNQAAARPKTTLRANAEAHHGTSRHVAVFGGASATKSKNAGIRFQAGTACRTLG